MAQKRQPCLPDINTLIAAGFDPKTGLPVRMTPEDDTLFEDARRAIRIIDEQDAVNRFTWYNLPDGIDSQMLERMLYYKGQLAFFYFEEMEKYYIMPYALDGGIDFYGRFTSIHPVPMSGGTTEEDKKITQAQAQALSLKKLVPLYEVVAPEELLAAGPEMIAKSCVLLKDYTEQLSQTVIARQIINEPIVGAEAQCLPFMMTALLRSTGVKGVRVGNQDEQANVYHANIAIKKAALNGQVNIPIVGAVDFQELNDGQVGKGEEFMMALQSLDNFRLSTYGLDNGGLFQKRQHMLQSEQEMNAAGGGSVGLILQDGLTRRQRFCDIINSYTGIGIWCDVSETASGADKNMDGELSDQQDQSGTAEGNQPTGGNE